MNQVVGLFSFRVLYSNVVQDTMATDMNIFASSDEAHPSTVNPVSTFPIAQKLWINRSHERYGNIMKVNY